MDYCTGPRKRVDKLSTFQAIPWRRNRLQSFHLLRKEDHGMPRWGWATMQCWVRLMTRLGRWGDEIHSAR